MFLTMLLAVYMLHTTLKHDSNTAHAQPLLRDTQRLNIRRPIVTLTTSVPAKPVIQRIVAHAGARVEYCYYHYSLGRGQTLRVAVVLRGGAQQNHPVAQLK